MILDAGKEQYKIVREVFCGEKNDVFVCDALHSRAVSCQTVWKIKDREIAKFILREFERQENDTVYDGCFVIEDVMYVLFPYEQERPLHRFYAGTVAGTACTPERIWQRIVTECMAKRLPDALMYLLFEQKQLQLAADGSIWFQYFLDLSKLDVFIQQKDCVKACAKLLCALMRETPGQAGVGVQLLEKRLKRAEYTDYLTLYRDIRLIAEEPEKRSLLERMRKFWRRKTEGLIKAACVLCGILFVTAVGMFLSRLFFGDRLLFRLFTDSLERIGTESLLQ